MRKSLLAVAVVGGLLAGCSQDASVQRTAQVQSAKSPEASIQTARHGAASIASLPDRGSLLAYDRTQAPVRRGAYTWHPAQLSEAYALRAIADGSMRVTGPAGQPIQLQYERHVEHPDGNWTWIGSVAGAGKGAEAILTFGKDAVFGTIANGRGAPLQVTTAGGRTWVIDPVDGTYNFLHGSTYWCSAIALKDRDDVMLGAIFQPEEDKLWLGGRDRRATLNGDVLTVFSDDGGRRNGTSVAELGAATYIHPP